MAHCSYAGARCARPDEEAEMDNRAAKDELDLTALASELQALETGTFEIRDYADAGDLMSVGCSSGDLCSCACTFG
jgi:hypothetical protein